MEKKEKTGFDRKFWGEEHKKIVAGIRKMFASYDAPLRLWNGDQGIYNYNAPYVVQYLVEIYTRVSSGVFNDRLRGSDTDMTDRQWGKVLPPVRRVMKESGLPWNDLIQMLVEYVHKAPVTPQPLTVWRGIYQYKKEPYKIGDVIRDPGFSSFTFDPFFATAYISRRARLALKTPDIPRKLCCLFRVELPAGVHALYDEGEFQLILAALTRFVVKEINTIQTAAFSLGPYGMSPEHELEVEVLTLQLQRIPPSPLPKPLKAKAKPKRRKRQPL